MTTLFKASKDQMQGLQDIVNHYKKEYGAVNQDSSEESEFKIKYALDTQMAEHTLELENLQIRHVALISEYDMRIQSVQRERDALSEALKKQSKRSPVLWVAIGVASGMALSYGAYRAFNE